MINYTPVNLFDTYPVTLPAVGDNILTTIVNTYKDVYNKLENVKQLCIALDSTTDSQATDISDLETSTNELIAQVADVITNISTLTAIVGTNTYSSENYISNADTHGTALGKLDTQVKTNSDDIDTAEATIVTHTSNIDSIAGKVSTTATDGETGFAFAGTTFLEDEDNTEESLIKLDTVTAANRRVLDAAYKRSVYNWADKNSIVRTDIQYDTLIDDSKIYPDDSTPLSYNEQKMEFTQPSSGWVFYSVLKSVTAVTTGEVKLQAEYSGTVQFYFTYGGYSGTFVEITSMDTWTAEAVGGTALVLKVVGTAGSKLFSYELLHKE